MASGFVMTLRGSSPQSGHTGKPGLGGTGGEGEGALVGVMPVGERLGAIVSAQPQRGMTSASTIGHWSGAINPSRPALCKFAHDWGSASVGTSTSGNVTLIPKPQTVQIGKPGLGGMGVAAGEAVGEPTEGAVPG